jgi:hypothetical protein
VFVHFDPPPETCGPPVLVVPVLTCQKASFGVTSIPVSRDAARGETISQCRHLKSPRCMSRKIQSICPYSPAIYPMETSLHRENYHDVGHAVNCFIGAINCRFDSSPLLDYDHQRIFEFRRARGKFQSRKNMCLIFKVVLTSETHIPGVSPNGGGP